MSEILTTSQKAREALAKGLSALQSDPAVPPSLVELAAPIAQAMGALHQIERAGGTVLQPHVETALAHVRNALAGLQAQGGATPHPAVMAAMEAVASSLGGLHALGKMTVAAPAPQPVQPAPVVAQPVVAQPVVAQPVQPAPVVAQPVVAQPVQPAPVVAQPVQPAPVVAQPVQPAPVVAQPVVAQPVQPAPVVAQPVVAQPVQHAPVPVAAPSEAGAFPAQGSDPFLPGENASAKVAPAPAAAPVAPVAAAPVAAPVAPVAAPRAADPFASPAGAPRAASGPMPTVNADLGAHSPTNFYKGLAGNDIIDHGGLFVATYLVPRIGSAVRLRVSLPGSYEFDAEAIVKWARDSGSSDTPGFGAQFTQISAEARQLVYRYVRNREPIFYDDL